MKRSAVFALACLLVLGAGSARAETLSAIEVTGNGTVKTEYIKNAVQLKAGDEYDSDKVQADSKRIYDMGYFESVDAKVNTNPDGTVTLDYVVKENPLIQDITFKGNTIYKESDLTKLMFSKPGMVFNHLFFQNDLQRLRDKFQHDGYVMTRVKDVNMENGHVVVTLGEAKVGEVIIQGNKRTKTSVIARYFPIKTGDLFNAITLRHSVARVRQLGFLDDVTVGFEPTDDPDTVNLVVNVREKKSASVMLSISYGSSSGWGGGISYRESNLSGLGQTLEVGFDKGNYTNYWARWSDDYMDSKHFSWKAGVYRNEDEELVYRYRHYDRFTYDEQRIGAYLGLGRKFGHQEKYSWYLTADWHSSKISTAKYSAHNNAINNGYGDFVRDYYVNKDALDSKVFTTTLEVTRDNTDRYLPYAKGDRETLGIEKAWRVFGGKWDYTKYWGQVSYYAPQDWVRDIAGLGITDDRPAILALRLRAGSSSGEIPLSEQYSLGGANTIRGYASGYEHGNKMVMANAELRVPIDENVSVVAFYDIGRVWNDLPGDPLVEAVSKKQSHWLKSPGLGLRFNTPLGNVRIDVAQGTDVTGKTQTEYHFGFGEMF